MTTWWKMPGGEWWSPDAKGPEAFTLPVHISAATFAKGSGGGDMAAGLAGLAMAQIKREPLADPLADLRAAVARHPAPK